MKLYHCFRDPPQDPWSVWLPRLEADLAHPSDQERLQAYLDEQAEYGMQPDVYYAAKTPLWGYGPFVEVIEAPGDVVFRGACTGEFLIPSDTIENREVFFNSEVGEEWGIENPGLPEWR